MSPGKEDYYMLMQRFFLKITSSVAGAATNVHLKFCFVSDLPSETFWGYPILWCHLLLMIK